MHQREEIRVIWKQNQNIGRIGRLMGGRRCNIITVRLKEVTWRGCVVGHRLVYI